MFRIQQLSPHWVAGCASSDAHQCHHCARFKKVPDNWPECCRWPKRKEFSKTWQSCKVLKIVSNNQLDLYMKHGIDYFVMMNWSVLRTLTITCISYLNCPVELRALPWIPGRPRRLSSGHQAKVAWSKALFSDGSAIVAHLGCQNGLTEPQLASTKSNTWMTIAKLP